jgi:hypothetical protein
MATSDSTQPIPQRTGSVFFVRVSCRDLKRMAIANGMTVYRLSTDGGVFFFDKRQFDVDSLQRQIGRGCKALIGAHRLRDGSAWLHWISLGKNRIWAPEPEALPRRWLALVALMFCWVPIPIAQMLPDSLSIGWTLLWVLLFASAVGTLGWSLYRLMLECHPGRRRLRAALAALRDGRQPALSISPSYSNAPDLALADGIYGDMGLLQGTLSDVDVALITYGSGRYSYRMHEYQLRCSGETFRLRTLASELRQVIDPVLIRRPPLFVADGDRVVLLSSMSDGEVRGLLNHSDGMAHVAYKGAPHSPTARRIVLGLAAFIPVVATAMVLVSEVYSWYERGIGPDYWDWLELLQLGGSIMLMMILIIGGVALIGERFHHGYYQSRAHPPIERILGVAFQWRLRQRRSATINEIT